jgi:hypothetical protein
MEKEGFNSTWKWQVAFTRAAFFHEQDPGRRKRLEAIKASHK